MASRPNDLVASPASPSPRPRPALSPSHTLAPVSLMSPSLQIAPPLPDHDFISTPHTIVAPASTSFRAASPALIQWFNLIFILFDFSYLIHIYLLFVELYSISPIGFARRVHHVEVGTVAEPRF